MTPLPIPLPRLARNGLAAPTGDDFRRALRAAAREDAAAVWEDLCAQAGVPVPAFLLDLDAADRLAAAMTALPGLCGLAGRSMTARVRAYRALAAQEERGGGTAVDWSRRALEELLRSRPADRARLEEIVDLDLFRPEVAERMEQAARAAAERFGTYGAALTLVLEDSQLVLGLHGVDGWMKDAGGAPVEWSFCTTPVRTRAPYVVEDMTADVLQRTNPFVRHDGVRCYVGVPLITSRGHVIGAYCLFEGRSRTVAPEDVHELEQMAARVVAELERERLSQRCGV